MQRSVARAGGLVLGVSLALAVGPAYALISRPLPLSHFLAQSDFILTAKVAKIDTTAETPRLLLAVDEDLKGKAPFRKLGAVLTGDSDAKKLDHTPQLLKRLAADLPLVVFVSKSARGFIAFAYTNGTWFQMKAEQAGDSEPVVWSFTHCEPYLRRTYKEGTADLRQVVIDGLADKKAPPDVDLKVDPGLGPELKPAEPAKPEQPEQVRAAGGPVFAVIPTVLVGGPLAILALMFPAVFGGLTLVFRRWLVVLSIISLDSTLFVLHDWLSPWIKNTWWGTPAALWAAMSLVTVAGLVWSWRRHLAVLDQEALAPAAQPGGDSPATPAPSATLPRGGEYLGLWVMSLLGVVLVGVCLLWHASLVDGSWRKPTLVMVLGLWAGTLYTLYLRRSAGRGSAGRTALPAEGVMLAVMVAAGAALGLTTLPRAAAASTGELATTGEREAGAEVARPIGFVWKFEPQDAGTIASSPLVAGDRVYIAAAHGGVFEKYGRLYCLDRASGKEVWRFDDDHGMKQVFSTPCLADGRLYVGEGFHQDSNCKLYCLDASTGKKQWEFTTNSHTESSPCILGGNVYFGAGDDGVFCVDAAGGKEVWHYPGLHVDCNPCVAGGRLYAGSGVGDTYRETCLFCLDAATGKEVWRVPADLPVWGSPTLAGKHVFAGLGNGNFLESADMPAGALLCLDADTGQAVWRCDVPDGVLDRPGVDRHAVYFGSRDGHCYCVDRRTGKQRWKYDLRSPMVTAPALARAPGGAAVTAVYAAASGGRVYCLDPDGGTADWTLDVGEHVKGEPELLSSPAVAVSREAGGERRQLFFGAGLKSPVGESAVLYCHEDRLDDQ
jgi:outer membrane protein assembly factor BamB